MINKNFSEIISENKKLKTKLKNNKIPIYKIGILSNIMIHQSKDIGEYLLRKKEILAESNLLKLSNLAAVIVIPDLLTPGIREIA